MVVVRLEGRKGFQESTIHGLDSGSHYCYNEHDTDDYTFFSTKKNEK